MTVNVWITGHNGFIAKHLAEYLSKQTNLVVMGIGRGAGLTKHFTSTIEDSLTVENLDLLVSKTSPPDYVYHLAGGSSVGRSIADPRADFNDSVGGASELLAWAKVSAPTAKIIMTSSAAVYGQGHVLPIKEDSQLSPSSPYGTHKLAVEQLALSYGRTFGIATTCLRLFSVYGPRLEKQLIFELFKKLRGDPKQLELHGTGEERRDWIHVHDAVRAMWLARNSASVDSPAINIGSGIGTSVAALAAKVAGAAGSSVHLKFSGKSPSGDPSYLVANTDKLMALGHVHSTSLESGLASTFNWFADEYEREDANRIPRDP